MIQKVLHQFENFFTWCTDKKENTKYRVYFNFFKLCLLESALNPVLDLLLTYETCDWLFSGDNILNNNNNIFYHQCICFAVYLSDIRVFILNWSSRRILLTHRRIFMEGQRSPRKQGMPNEHSVICSLPNDFNNLKVFVILGSFSSTAVRCILCFNLLKCYKNLTFEDNIKHSFSWQMLLCF